MATYIPNVTDTFPEIQPFRPDYSFLQSALQYKQSKFDAAFNQLNSIYGSILNAPLTRGINQQRRDEFIKSADAEMKKITSLDLSLPQNVQLASNVFKPFYEDQNLVYDITFTKKAQNALAQGERLKNCLTDDCEGKYSPESIQAIKYRLMEFAAADDEQARKISSPEYVPYVNIFGEAEKMLGDKFTNISIDEKSGGYIVTTKNGPKAFNLILQQLSSTLGVDPNVKRYAQTHAYVQAMNEIVPNANNKYNGNIQAAKNEYFVNYAQDFINNDKAKIVLTQRNLDDVESKLNIYDARINKGSNLSNKEKLEYQNLLREKQIYDSNISGLNDRVRILNESLNSENYSALESAGLQSSAGSYIGDSIKTAAEIQAYKNYSVSMKEDPYTMIDYKNKQDWAYKQMEKELDFQYKIKEKELENEGAYDNFFPSATTTEAGQNIGNLMSEDREVFNQTWKTYSSDLSNTLESAFNIKDENIKNAVIKLLSSEGVNIDQIKSGNLGTTKLRAVHDKLNDLLSRYPELNSAISKPLSKTNDSRQMLDATDSVIAKNNKTVVNNLLADKAVNAEDKQILSAMFDKNGRLKDKNAAYKQYISTYGITSLQQAMSSGFASTEIQEFRRMVGLQNSPKQYFDKLYDDQKEKFDEKYTDFAINNQSYATVGGVGIGGGGGVTTDYVISGVADSDKRKKSKQTLALYDITSNLEGAKVAMGSPSTVRQDSGDDFEDIESDDLLNQYVSNLRLDMRMNKKAVGYTYSPLGLGSKKYATLHIKPAANDATLKALLGDNFNKAVTEGITVVIPKENIQNSFLNEKTSVNNREIILKSVGKYNYYNPKIQADITFTLQKDNTIVPSGTILNSKTNRTSFVPSNPIDFATFNSMLFGLDNYN